MSKSLLPILIGLAFCAANVHAATLDQARELSREIEGQLPEDMKSAVVIACAECDSMFESGEEAVANLERMLTLTAQDPDLPNVNTAEKLGDKLRDNLIAVLSGDAYESLSPEDAKFRFCELARPDINLFSAETFGGYCKPAEAPPVTETPAPPTEAPAPTPEPAPAPAPEPAPAPAPEPAPAPAPEPAPAPAPAPEPAPAPAPEPAPAPAPEPAPAPAN